MRSVHESNVTVEPGSEPRAGGVWTLAASGAIINEPEGPATLLVPTEQVLLLAVDLPLSSRAKRLEALPFAIEDRIAEPVDSVHLALGAEISPKRYLVAVVRHETMIRWIAGAEAVGLSHAAMVPDALTLPVAELEGAWMVDSRRGRVLVRSAEGGFAFDEAMFATAWQAAGQPPVMAWNQHSPADVPVAGVQIDSQPLAERVRNPAVDLRQGAYARRAVISNTWRRLGWIVGIGVAAHIAILFADTIALRIIANRREADTRALIQQTAPGTALQGDLATSVAALLPSGGGGGGVPQTFIPLVGRISAALAPLGAINARSLEFQAETLTMDLDGQPGLSARIRDALKNARIKATVTESPDGAIRITAGAA
ncbi:type II secretion system protein GspL [Sphingomonas sp. AOB5]|uniref:type II secretion system protein GspL n=1 Tax=Sphingomonas sp. AOB5 TaxID=3034017 RepID=UPI0023F8FAA6|nr:type II secretion system protein GspL [Sphingomonas sp. AOB5]MDF7777720.1 type II secretion system protein GspL [Sphingomonas sp. AOB5]